MRATRFSLTFVALALCSSGHAGPCKPKSSTTALVGTTSTEATLSASAEISTATSVAESSTTDLSSIISESITSTATATSDSQFSSSTELSTSFITTKTAIATTSAAELSSSAETLTTSNTAEATTSDAPTTTATTEDSTPSNLFLNPSVSFNSDLAHSGSHSAYWSVENTAQNGVVRQTVTLEENKVYTLSYWWYVDEDEQPQNIDCYITLEQRSTDGTTATFAGFQVLTTPLPLKTWTKEETGFNSITITPAVMSFSVVCASSAGSGLKIAIDDVYMAKQA
ncbi:hypothetical protein Forpe1208_v006981 [Fusarium oxysporum f. sp. rapae]|uniref:CBM-cenC domain-containing protein n=1 Tax=Fusarium oxysporum f. sp. rapae TaxID=485398 RepID=A0A8J5UBX7_FUSOX|nr:hypothetical protein Forpe1208_v006981 [Fusarium oxysporum f. sp. rapae]